MTLISTLKKSINVYILKYLGYRKVIYRVLKIDPVNYQVLLQIKGKRAVFSTNFVDIMESKSMLQSISALDACCIGFHYGRSSRSFSKKRASFISNFSFSMDHSFGQYRLISENGFTGEIKYIDKIYKKEFVELPTAVVQSSYIINKFDPTQACYIGFLAGIMIEKELNKKTSSSKEKIQPLLQKKPMLRVVK